MKKIFFFTSCAGLILFIYLTGSNRSSIIQYSSSKEKSNVPSTKHLKTFLHFNSSEPTVLCREISNSHLVTLNKNTLPIFKRDGSLQCDKETRSSLKEMRKMLTKMGIPVVKSTKGYLPTGRRPAVCGEPTNNINIFYIANTLKNEQMKSLIKKGFKSCVK